MDIKTLSDELSVSGQISTNDLEALKNLGVKSVICNRPDDEEPGQPHYASIAEAASDLELEMKFQPVLSNQLNQVDVLAFNKIVNDLPKPVHAYCRSGTRCTILWALSELAQGKDRASVLRQAATAGYDLSRNI